MVFFALCFALLVCNAQGFGGKAVIESPTEGPSTTQAYSHGLVGELPISCRGDDECPNKSYCKMCDGMYFGVCHKWLTIHSECEVKEGDSFCRQKCAPNTPEQELLTCERIDVPEGLRFSVGNGRCCRLLNCEPCETEYLRDEHGCPTCFCKEATNTTQAPAIDECQSDSDCNLGQFCSSCTGGLSQPRKCFPHIKENHACVLGRDECTSQCDRGLFCFTGKHTTDPFLNIEGQCCPDLGTCAKTCNTGYQEDNNGCPVCECNVEDDQELEEDYCYNTFDLLHNRTNNCVTLAIRSTWSDAFQTIANQRILGVCDSFMAWWNSDGALDLAPTLRLAVNGQNNFHIECCPAVFQCEPQECPHIHTCECDLVVDEKTGCHVCPSDSCTKELCTTRTNCAQPWSTCKEDRCSCSETWVGMHGAVLECATCSSNDDCGEGYTCSTCGISSGWCIVIGQVGEPCDNVGTCSETKCAAGLECMSVDPVYPFDVAAVGKCCPPLDCPVDAQGSWRDENGCPTCTPCPDPFCEMDCPYGFKHNEVTGCPMCECAVLRGSCERSDTVSCECRSTCSSCFIFDGALRCTSCFTTQVLHQGECVSSCPEGYTERGRQCRLNTVSYVKAPHKTDTTCDIVDQELHCKQPTCPPTYSLAINERSSGFDGHCCDSFECIHIDKHCTSDAICPAPISCPLGWHVIIAYKATGANGDCCDIEECSRDYCETDYDCGKNAVCIIPCGKKGKECRQKPSVGQYCATSVFDSCAQIDCADGLVCHAEESARSGVCCPPQAPCDNICQYGYQKSQEGCPTCTCIEEIPIDECNNDTDCPDDETCRSNCLNRVCVRRAQLGEACGVFVDPCEESQCSAGLECDVMDRADDVGRCCQPFNCGLVCTHGFRRDSNGCKICVCSTEPTKYNFPDNCPIHSHFSPCKRNCVPKCVGYQRHCDSTCTAACTCDTGYVALGDTCVLPERCAFFSDVCYNDFDCGSDEYCAAGCNEDAARTCVKYAKENDICITTTGRLSQCVRPKCGLGFTCEGDSDFGHCKPRKETKVNVGTCPVADSSNKCEKHCNDDGDCDGAFEKCCSYSCGRTCIRVAPIEKCSAKSTPIKQQDGSEVSCFANSDCPTNAFCDVHPYGVWSVCCPLRCVTDEQCTDGYFCRNCNGINGCAPKLEKGSACGGFSPCSSTCADGLVCQVVAPESEDDRDTEFIFGVADARGKCCPDVEIPTNCEYGRSCVVDSDGCTTRCTCNIHPTTCTSVSCGCPLVRDTATNCLVCPVAKCFSDACEGAVCPAYPDATCEVSTCGGCKTRWLVDDKEVSCGESCASATSPCSFTEDCVDQPLTCYGVVGSVEKCPQYACKPKCFEENTHWEDCANDVACDPTCDDPNPFCSSEKKCHARCVCDDGFIMKDGKCFAESECNTCQKNSDCEFGQFCNICSRSTTVVGTCTPIAKHGESCGKPQMCSSKPCEGGLLCTQNTKQSLTTTIDGFFGNYNGLCCPRVKDMPRCLGTSTCEYDCHGCPTKCFCVKEAVTCPSINETLCECGTKKNTETGCMECIQETTCDFNPCDVSQCKMFPFAMCKPNYCGGCNAEWTNDDGSSVECDTITCADNPCAEGKQCEDRGDSYRCLNPCRKGHVWTEHGSGCEEPTCQNPTPKCNLESFPRCQCPQGTVQQLEECIPYENCPVEDVPCDGNGHLGACGNGNSINGGCPDYSACTSTIGGFYPKVCCAHSCTTDVECSTDGTVYCDKCNGAESGICRAVAKVGEQCGAVGFGCGQQQCEDNLFCQNRFARFAVDDMYTGSGVCCESVPIPHACPNGRSCSYKENGCAERCWCSDEDTTEYEKELLIKNNATEKTCYDVNAYWSECAGSCDADCSNPVAFCPMGKCVAKCVCKPGFAVDFYGDCIKIENCDTGCSKETPCIEGYYCETCSINIASRGTCFPILEKGSECSITHMRCSDAAVDMCGKDMQCTPTADFENNKHICCPKVLLPEFCPLGRTCQTDDMGCPIRCQCNENAPLLDLNELEQCDCPLKRNPFTLLMECPSIQKVECSQDLCLTAICPGQKEAKCNVVSECGECKVQWSDSCGKPLMCDITTCADNPCKNHEICVEKLNGACFPNAAGSTVCDPVYECRWQCPTNMVWEDCPSTCTPSCTDPHPFCEPPQTCVGRCVCAEGFVNLGALCIEVKTQCNRCESDDDCTSDEAEEYCSQCWRSTSLIGTCQRKGVKGDKCNGRDTNDNPFLCNARPCGGDLICQSSVALNTGAPRTPTTPGICCPKVDIPKCFSSCTVDADGCVVECTECDKDELVKTIERATCPLYTSETPCSGCDFVTDEDTGCPFCPLIGRCNEQDRLEMCAQASCPAHPEAECRINKCGGCNVEFFDKNTGRAVECGQSCDSDPCGSGEICVDAPAVCVKAPCKQYKCVPKCKSGMVWNDCGSNSEGTCTNLNPLVVRECIPKCECPFGSFLKHGSCVAFTACSKDCKGGKVVNEDGTKGNKCTCGDTNCFHCGHSECLRCRNSFYLYKGECVPSCPANSGTIPMGSTTYGRACVLPGVCDVAAEEADPSIQYPCTCGDYCKKCTITDVDNISCESCEKPRYAWKGACVKELLCSGGKVFAGQLQGTKCSCSNPDCFRCTHNIEGKTCKTCRNSKYMHNSECLDSCPAGLAEVGTASYGRYCSIPFSCRAGRSLDLEETTKKCKCPDENCFHCELKEGKDYECLRCRSKKFLYNGTCHDSCDAFENTVSYGAGSYGRMCRAPFKCSASKDEQGNKCSCPKNCFKCEYTTTQTTAKCTRCRNSAFLVPENGGYCASKCPTGYTESKQSKYGSECLPKV